MRLNNLFYVVLAVAVPLACSRQTTEPEKDPCLGPALVIDFSVGMSEEAAREFGSENGLTLRLKSYVPNSFEYTMNLCVLPADATAASVAAELLSRHASIIKKIHLPSAPGHGYET